jgi:hypothetical protein
MDRRRRAVKAATVMVLLLLSIDPAGGARRGTSIFVPREWNSFGSPSKRALISGFLLTDWGFHSPPSVGFTQSNTGKQTVHSKSSESWYCLLMVSKTLDWVSWYHCFIAEPDVRSSGKSFAFNYTLAKAIVEYASAVRYFSPLHFSWMCHMY